MVLISIFSPVSGAHLNPAVTLAFLVRRSITTGAAAAYIICQLTGGVLGTWAAHLMFGEAIFQISTKARTEPGMWFAEVVATFGLVLTIFGTLRWKAEAVPLTVGLHHVGVLVHRVHELCKSCRDACTRGYRHLYRHTSGRRPRICAGSACWGYRGNSLFRMAVFVAISIYTTRIGMPPALLCIRDRQFCTNVRPWHKSGPKPEAKFPQSALRQDRKNAALGQKSGDVRGALIVSQRRHASSWRQ